MKRDRLGFLASVLFGIAFLATIILCASCGCTERPNANNIAPPVSPMERLVKTIKDRLGDRNLDVRVAAAGAIVKMVEVDVNAAVPLIEYALLHEDPEVRLTVAWAFNNLAERSPESAAHIFEIAERDQNSQVRFHVAYALRFMPLKFGSSKLLHGALNDSDSMVRFAAEESQKYLMWRR